MVSERRVSPGEIIRYVNEMQREIDELEKRLQSLRAAAGGGGGGGGAAAAASPRRRGRPPGSRNRARAAGAAAAAPAAGGGAKGRRRGRRRSNITPEQLASRQLQGRYLGLIRQIPASKRRQYA